MSSTSLPYRVEPSITFPYRGVIHIEVTGALLARHGSEILDPNRTFKVTVLRQGKDGDGAWTVSSGAHRPGMLVPIPDTLRPILLELAQRHAHLAPSDLEELPF